MAVTSVELAERECSMNAAGVLTARERYIVECDDEEDTCETARTASGVPQRGEYFLSTDALFASSRAKDAGDLRTFHVDVEYTSKPGREATEPANPLERPAKFSYGGSATEEDFFKDFSEEPKHVVNSAGEPFEPSPRRLVFAGTITVTRNVANFDDDDRDTYRCTMNNSAITINGVEYLGKTLLCVSISASGPNVENGITFWEEVIEIHKNPETWDLKALDYGYSEKSGTGLVKITDKANQPVSKPWPLNGSGLKQPNATDAPAEINYVRYKAEDWSGLFPSEEEEE
jgi:hypothetical protein